MFGIFPQVTCHLGLDHARADGIGADIGAKIKAKTFGEHGQSRLARRIARSPSHWHQRARRGYVDDGRACSGAQHRQRRINDIEGSGQVDRQHTVPAFGFQFAERLDSQYAGGVLASTSIDPVAKGMAQLLLDFPIPISDGLLD